MVEEKVMRIELYSKENFNNICWPSTELGKRLSAYLSPFLLGEVETLIENVKTRLYILRVNDHFLPITVNEEEYDNSYVASNYYAVQFVDKGMLSHMMERLMDRMRINKMVMVNNFLLTASLFPKLCREEVEAITPFLLDHFPDHMICFRYVDLHSNASLATFLEGSGYKLCKTRYVHILDSDLTKISAKALSHHRKDLKLNEKLGYEIVDGKRFSDEDIKRSIALYEKVYVEKYTAFSPRYTEAFLRRVIEHNIFEIYGLKKKGKLDAVTGIFCVDNSMINPFFGYDVEVKEAKELYRLMTMVVIEKAKEKGLVFNDSSGAERTKQWRGLKPYLEYTAFYVKHLPKGRKFFWNFAHAITNRIIFPIVKKKQLSAK